MTGLGISHDEALYYEEQFHAGKAIVIVHAGDLADQAAKILRNHGGFIRRDNFPDDGPTPPIYTGV